MQRRIQRYFDEVIVPLVEGVDPELLSEAAIVVGGSVGPGFDAPGSDLDAFIYLDDPLWKEHGGRLQLALQHCSPRYSPQPQPHPEFCVWPLSWLGDLRAFLGDADRPGPWEKVLGSKLGMERLFHLQRDLILADPRKVFGRLREASVPARMPERLWRKLLIERLAGLLDMGELQECFEVIAQGKTLEASIIFGTALEGLLQTGFLIERQYYPYRKHLRRAFGALPLAHRVLPLFDAAAASSLWPERVDALAGIRDAYVAVIRDAGTLEGDILDDLIWAQRCEAWDNPRWQQRIIDCRVRAVEAGYPADDAWIWSLWNWLR